MKDELFVRLHFIVKERHMGLNCFAFILSNVESLLLSVDVLWRIFVIMNIVHHLEEFMLSVGVDRSKHYSYFS